MTQQQHDQLVAQLQNLIKTNGLAPGEIINVAQSANQPSVVTANLTVTLNLLGATDWGTVKVFLASPPGNPDYLGALQQVKVKLAADDQAGFWQALLMVYMTAKAKMPHLGL